MDHFMSKRVSKLTIYILTEKNLSIAGDSKPSAN